MTTLSNAPDQHGHFGAYGGRYVPETLMNALEELERAYIDARRDQGFLDELRTMQRDFIGRPTSFHLAERLTEHVGGAQIWLKREDLA
ncbi:MAG: tryptophan synthase subunit beta, partial [Phycisphaerales bacterium]|nr:tryptophan synthase subunit beta [Phycisphaerales bacterium]